MAGNNSNKPTSLAELITQADVAAATTRENMAKVQERLQAARANGGSVYNALLHSTAPAPEEPKRIERAERMTKVQALGDFVSALGSGIAGLGSQGKGYVPATPNTSTRTIADMRNLRDLYNKRMEAQRSAEAQLAAQQHEANIAGLEADYARMAKELEKQEKKRDDLAKEQRTEESRLAAEQREQDWWKEKEEITTDNTIKEINARNNTGGGTSKNKQWMVNVGNGERWAIPQADAEALIPLLYESMVAAYPETAAMRTISEKTATGNTEKVKVPIDSPSEAQKKQQINTYLHKYPELIKLLADELGIDYELPEEEERIPLSQLSRRASVMTDSAGNVTDHDYASFNRMKEDFKI